MAPPWSRGGSIIAPSPQGKATQPFSAGKVWARAAVAGGASPGSTIPPGISSETPSVPWRYCSISATGTEIVTPLAREHGTSGC